MKKLLILTLFVFIGSINAQSYDDASEASELCLLVQGSIGNNFMNDKEAEAALEKILSVIGASKRFVLQPCNKINNAVATSYKGVRYILYDNEFMNKIANNSTSWFQLFILAHEVGHHINGHSIDILLAAADVVEPKTLAAKRTQELESDEFAGFILGKLGASIEQTSKAVNLLASNKDDTYYTHPNKAKRLNAIKIGFNKALEKEQVIYEEKSNLNTAEEYFYAGLEKYYVQNYNGAVADFTKAIEINPNFDIAYNNRGFVRMEEKKYSSALIDFSKAIEINPDDGEYYFNRAQVKKSKKNYYNAIADYTKATEINPNYFFAYFQRGNAKFKLNDYYGAIADYTKAIEINPNIGEFYFMRSLLKKSLKNYYGSIADVTKAIEISPNKSLYYSSRGNLKIILNNDYYGAIADFTKAIEINPNTEGSYYDLRGNAKIQLKQYFEAISDITKAIKIEPNNSDYYGRRGLAKTYSKDFYGAIADFTKAIEISPNGIDYFGRGLSKLGLNDLNGACQDFLKAQKLGVDTSELINSTCK